MNKLNVAIVGQGRSGRNIHGRFFKTDDNTLCQVVAVVEIDEKRRKRAQEEWPGCDIYESHTELYGRKDIDLVVNATMSKDHYAVAKDLLENGFNVVVEKPFARTRLECDTLINIAKKNNLVLSVFHQSLFAPHYEHAKEVIASGKLGEIKQIDISYSGFSRRWDWQTLQAFAAGNIYNTGPHPLGHALGFLDFDPATRVVFSRLDCVMSSGDSDDYAKIILTAPGKPVVDVEVNSNDAYPRPHCRILGSRGSYSASIAGGEGGYQMKYYLDSENPEKEVIPVPLEDAEGLPCYCSEELKTHEESGNFKGSAFDVGTRKFYEMMYNAIRNGAPLAIKPEYAAQVISVIEEVHAANPLPVKF